MDSTDAENIRGDVAELETFLSSAKRVRVQRLLEGEIALLRKQLAPPVSTPPISDGATSPVPTLESAVNSDPSPAPASTPAPPIAPAPVPAHEPSPPSVPVSAPPSTSTGRPPSPILPVPLAVTKADPNQQQQQEVQYSTLSTFSWDQDSERVKVYIFLEGVPKDKACIQFTPRSFDLKLHDVKGRNYRCSVPALGGQINPEQSKLVVKSSRVVVSMRKGDWGHWGDIRHKENDKFKPKPHDDTKDPMAGIMDLMKTMYEDGDEEMKKTIAKAWTDARSNPGGGPSPMGGMGLGDTSSLNF